MSKKKKRKKYSKWLGEEYLAVQNFKQEYGQSFPQELLHGYTESGIFFGLPQNKMPRTYVGISEGYEGNILVIGGSGSGKTSGVIMTTTKAWNSILCVTDIKGEISCRYKFMYDYGLVERPYIVFNLMSGNGYSYDFFWWLRVDDEYNLKENINEIVCALIPQISDSENEFWDSSERSLLTAALLYFFKQGLNFIQSVCMILDMEIAKLCKLLSSCGDRDVTMPIGNMGEMKSEHLAIIDRGLRNKLSLFVSNPYVCNALQGNNEKVFVWNDLEEYNVFLCIPEDKLEQLGAIVNVMYSQLIHFLMRRPDKYSDNGKSNQPILLLMDEVAQFGKLEVLPRAITTLRSKNVNICLALQSLAQLDKYYGELDRRIILDNCRYKLILEAGDPETQQYLCQLIGKKRIVQQSLTEHYDDAMTKTSCGVQFSESLDWKIQPEELAYLRDIILLSPYGVYKIKKFCEYTVLNDFYLSNSTYRTLVNRSNCRKELSYVPSIDEITATAQKIIDKS